MEGLVQEGGEVIKEDMDDGIKDAALIAAAQRVEHYENYEIAGYGCVRAYATRLREDDAATLLSQTLQEEMEMTVTTETDSTNHLKSIFDQSLAVLCEDKDSVRARSQMKWLRRSSLPLHVDAVNLRKRALDNAAQALSTLWKISEPKHPKPQSRATQYNGSAASVQTPMFVPEKL